MRLSKLMMLFALAGGVAFATACGGDTKDSDTDGPGTVTTDGDDDDDTYVTVVYDTAWFNNYYKGAGVVDGATYTGTESFVIEDGQVAGAGTLLCEYGWVASGSIPSTASDPCEDPDGTPCAFTLDVTLSDGKVVAECGGTTPGSTSTYESEYTYGFTYDYLAGGNSYGPSWMYLSGGTWYGVGPATFDGLNFDYEGFYYAYTYIVQ